ncbi:hypothetical protein F5148DRAFT_1168715 [Russula earlei]|uniref:Uncharacterized protein n=1 Tax=Russula earlei TaxID=71964 RepID=A0ACC0UKD1_9AGAM|nr:hypothetical protein F5148DRAFT_1168715 [Russula earlei]
MAERITGRPWSAYEDLLLSKAVAEFDGEADWKTIAQRVPGRTNKACRKRWLHSLSPSIKKSAWTKEEDERLMSLYKVYGTKWSVIARQIPGRTDDACSKRYREALDPALKKDEWTDAEDAKLLQLYSQLGGKWVQVGQQLQRSSLGCRNRWRLLERKRSPATREVTLTDSPLSRLHQASVRSESLPATDLSSSWPIFDPSHYWPPQAPLAFLPQQLQVQQSSDSARTAIPIPPSEGADYRTNPSMISSYRYPTSFVPVFATLDQAQHGLSYDETSEMPMQTDMLELQTNILLTLIRDLILAPRLLRNKHITPMNALSKILKEPCQTMITNYSRQPSETLLPESASSSPDTPSPVEILSRHTRPAEASAADRRLPRLSSTLATSSDLSIRGYACGHQRCLVNDSTGVQFLTSKELSDHIRTDHASDEFPDHKPYRCGLPGCNKSWKSVNGLQYHLQVSKAHFLQAITSFTSTVPATSRSPVLETSRKQKRPARTHPCPHANCPQVYKQLSGLRYHLSHVSRQY